MLRALLFDFNGVLVDDEPLHLALLGRVAAEEGLPAAGDRALRELVGLDDRASFAALFAGADQPATPERLARLVARKAAYYQEEIRRQGYPFFAGAAELVHAAAAEGLRLGVVTGALRQEVEGALRQAGLLERFQVIVTSEELANGKPDPEGYVRAVAGLNAGPPLPPRLVHPHEVAAIEDSPAGLVAAVGAGVRTVAVAHTHGPVELAGAELVAGSIAELTMARLRARFDSD